MSDTGTILARAVSDGEDRLLRAEEPLAGLQLRCGGDMPGTIAVPELLELVRKARRYGFRLARAVSAQDGSESITAWVEVEPLDEGNGCEIRLRNWQTSPLAPDDVDAAEGRRMLIERHLAELTAQLDASQRVLAVECQPGELQALAAAMHAGVGKPWTDFVTLDSNVQRHALHWRLLDGAKVSIDGSPRIWRAALIPQMPPGFEPVGFELLLVSDEPPPVIVSQGGASEEATTRSSLVGKDLAPVLRQPIARIIANAETIRTRLAGPLPDAYAEYAGEIANAGKFLLELLDDLADLEVVESDTFSVSPDQIDLAEVARQAGGILGVRAREKQIVIDAPQAGECLPAVAEFRRALQILLNLVGNAIRYSPDRSHIWIRLERDADRVRVIVADQGPGLSEQEQGRVFEKFERLGRSGDGGSGLGLFISRRLARAMGGELSVESTPGQGARFILELPADTAAQD